MGFNETVDIVTENTHRTLLYIGMVNDGGAAVPTRSVDEYWKAGRLKGGMRFSSALQTMAELSESLDAWSFGGESPSVYLQRLGWASATLRGLTLTPVGRALVRSLDLYDSRGEEVVEAILNVDDPFAYVKAIGLLRTGDEDALLVDPYLRAQQLHDVYRIPTINRALVSDKLSKDDLEQLAHAAQVVSQQRPFELRKASGIHDRYLIPTASDVRMLGGSLNTIGRSPITITTLSGDLSTHVREIHEELWRSATVVNYEPTPLATPQHSDESDSSSLDEGQQT